MTTPIGSGLPVRSYQGVPTGLESQVTQAVQSDPTLADPMLQLLRGVSGFDPASLSTSPNALQSGGVTSPQDAYRSDAPRLVELYGERVQLQEQTETVRSTVNQNTAAKKGAAPETRTPEQTVRIPPAQVENKIRTDASFRAQMEQRLGGRIILDDNADGNITVERQRPVDPARLQQQQNIGPLQPGAAAFIFSRGDTLQEAQAGFELAARLAGFGQQFGSTLQQLNPATAQSGQQLQQTDGSDPRWQQRMADGFDQALQVTFFGGQIPAGGFGGLAGNDQGFLSTFGNQSSTAASRFANVTTRFGITLDTTVEVFNSAQLGVQRSPQSI